MKTPCDQSPTCLHVACADCGRPVRSVGQLIADHPGTIIGYVSRQLCDTHDKQRRVRPAKRHEAPLQAAQHQATVRGLNNFMARIRGKSRERVSR